MWVELYLLGSIPESREEEASLRAPHMGLFSSIETKLEDKMMRKAMMQREVEMSLNISRARDSLMWFGSLYTAFVGGATVSKAVGKPVPGIAAVPVVLGGFALANMADMAYGNKISRVVKEAEYIMENERGRFIPPKQAPFAKLYGKEDRALASDVGAVGTYWPSFLPMARK